MAEEEVTINLQWFDTNLYPPANKPSMENKKETYKMTGEDQAISLFDYY